MKKSSKLFAILISIMIAVSMIPAFALAEDNSDISSEPLIEGINDESSASEKQVEEGASSTEEAIEESDEKETDTNENVNEVKQKPDINSDIDPGEEETAISEEPKKVLKALDVPEPDNGYFANEAEIKTIEFISGKTRAYIEGSSPLSIDGEPYYTFWDTSFVEGDTIRVTYNDDTYIDYIYNNQNGYGNLLGLPEKYRIEYPEEAQYEVGEHNYILYLLRLDEDKNADDPEGWHRMMLEDPEITDENGTHPEKEVELIIPFKIKARSDKTLKGASYTPVSKIEYKEYTNGSWDETEKAFYYYYSNRDGDKITITYSDDSSREFIFDSDEWRFESADDTCTEYLSAWANPAACESGDEACFNCMVYEYDSETDSYLGNITAEIPFTIKAGRKVKSIDYTPNSAEIKENTCGYSVPSGYIYNRYAYGDKLEIDYMDGGREKYVFRNGSFHNEDNSSLLVPGADIFFYDDQGEWSEKDQKTIFWGIGVHKVTVRYKNCTAINELEIIENDEPAVQSIEYIPALTPSQKDGKKVYTITQYTHGWWNDGCYMYNFYSDGDKLKINYEDGSNEIFTREDYQYYDRDGNVIPYGTINVYCSDPQGQSYDPDEGTSYNEWEIGEHTVNVYYKGFSCTYTIDLVEGSNKITGISLNSEKTLYYTPTDDTDDVNMYSLVNSEFLSGSTLNIRYGDKDVQYTYDAENWEFISTSDGYETIDREYIGFEPAESEWTYGNSANISVKYSGQSCTIPVTILSPIVSASYTPASGTRFYYYDGWDYVRPDPAENGAVITLVDGNDNETVYKYEETSNSNRWVLQTNGEIDRHPFVDDFRPDFDKANEQGAVPVMISVRLNSQSDRVYAGNSHAEKRSYEEFNVKEIAYTPSSGSLVMYEGLDSRTRYKDDDDEYYYDDDDEDEEYTPQVYEYFNFPRKAGDKLTVKYNDGSIIEYTATNTQYAEEGLWYYDSKNKEWLDSRFFNVTSDQSETNLWSEGDSSEGAHSFTVSYCGKSTSVGVQIKAYPIDNISYTDKDGSSTISLDAEEVAGERKRISYYYNSPYTYYNLTHRAKIVDEDDDDYYILFAEGDKLHVRMKSGETLTYTYSADNDDFYDSAGNKAPRHVSYDIEWDQDASPLKRGNTYNNVLSIGYASSKCYLNIFLDGEHEHSTTLVKHVPATCLKEGVIKYYTCSGCDKIFADKAATKELNKDELTEAITDHSWDEGVVTKEATTYKPGSVTYTCAICGEEKTETIPPAGTVTASGECGANGDNVKWDLYDDNTLLIYGSGAMGDADSGLTYTKYTEQVNMVIIDDGITEIGSGAFSGFTYLSSVTLPYGLTKIGNEAFKNCTGLGNIIIPDSVTSIGTDAFRYCGNVRINCNEGSYAHQYAVDNSIPYKLQDGETIIAEGSCGKADNDISWKLNDEGRLVITGEGEMQSYNYASASPFYKYGDDIKTVIIGSGVTSIGDYVFAGLYNAQTVSVPESVAGIGAYAFYGCRSLTAIYIPSGTEAIGNYAFSGCSKLDNVDIPDSFTAIGEGVFYGCSSLKSFDLHEGIESVGYSAFYDCSSLGGITLPSTLKTIGNNAFYGCSSLKSINIPKDLERTGSNSTYYYDYYAPFAHSGLESITFEEGTTSIYAGMFAYCQKLESISIPDTVTNIGNGVFYYCTKLHEVDLSDRLASLGYRAFGYSGIESVTIPKTLCNSDQTSSVFGYSALETISFENGAELIPSNMFADCVGLSEVTIPSTVETIGSYAFSGCTGLTKVNLNEGLETINDGAFSGCDSLADVALPASLGTIGNQAFYNCTSLKSINIPKNLKRTSASYNSISYGPFVYSGIESVSFASETTSIYGGLFAYCQKLTSLEIPETIKEIGEGAFYRSGLKTVKIPKSLCNADRDEKVFKGSALTTVTFGADVDYIPSYMFYDCESLKNVTIPDTVSTIGRYAFRGCTGIEVITIPAGVTNINDGAFSSCGNLNRVVLNEGLKRIGYQAFYNCTALSDVVIPATLDTLDNYAFYGCQELKSIGVPAGVESLGAYAFYGCIGLEEIDLNEGLKSIGTYALANCNVLETLIIPDSVKTIDSHAFDSCIGLTELSLPESLASLGNYVFSGCTGINKLSFTCLTVPQLSSYKFYGMSGLEEINVPADAYEEYVGALKNCVAETVKITTDFYAIAVKNLKTLQLFGSSAVISWSDHPGPEIEIYSVEADGKEIYTGASPARISKLNTGEENEIKVYGVDAAGKKTKAATITVIPKAPEVESVEVLCDTEVILPGEIGFVVKVKDSGNLDPIGENNDQMGGVLNFRNAESGTIITSGELIRDESDKTKFKCTLDLTRTVSGAYKVEAAMTDPDGVSGSKTIDVEVDASIPEKIKTFNAISATNSIELSWTIATEVNSTGYRIYRKAEDDSGFSVLTTVNDRFTLSYVDDTIDDDRLYTYYIVALGKYGQEGNPSDQKTNTRSPDEEKPVVSKISPKNKDVIKGSVKFSVTATDNVGVERTALYYSVNDGEDWILFDGTADTTQFSDGKFYVRGLAYDYAGNVSVPLDYEYTIDNSGPEKVTGLEYTATDVSVTLSWNTVTDNDISYFVVEKLNDGEYTAALDRITYLGADIYDLTPDTEYTYRVVGYDAIGNRGKESDPITVRTTEDKTIPVISRIQPPSGSYSESIPLSVAAKDEYTVKSVVIQLSYDGENWADIESKEYDDIKKTRTVEYALTLEDVDEGTIFVRALARDAAGNESVSGENATIVQYTVDRTAPSLPQGVKATGLSGYIELAWTQGSEKDLGTYSVYRSDSQNGEYKLIRSGIKAVKYADRNVEPGETKYYRINVNDRAGNISDMSAVVSATATEDTEAPEIISISPADGSRVGPSFRDVSVWASDNSRLKEILVEYSIDGTNFETLVHKKDMDVSDGTAGGSIDLDSLSDGDSVRVRAKAKDDAGHVSESVVADYTVDKTAPSAQSVSAAFKTDKVNISWKSLNEEDLAGFRVYRKEEGGRFSPIGQKEADPDSTSYIFADKYITDEAVTYIYRIEAVDKCGNKASFDADPLELSDRSAPKAVLHCESIMEIGAEYYIDASLSTDNKGIASYQIDFGDETEVAREAKPVHVYNRTGTFLISLKVTDGDGHESWTSKTVEVKDRSKVGTAKVHIVDEDGRAVPNADVYFDLASDDQFVRKTDASGNVSFTADAGSHKVGCIIPDNQWLPVKKDIIITAGAETRVTMTLEHHEMVEGRFEVERMTLDEIVAAGIDINDPDNQYYVHVDVYLKYEDYEYADEGLCNLKTRETTIGPILGPDIIAIPNLIFGGGPGGGGPGGGPGGGGSGGYDEISAIGWLIIPIDVSTLKEFFTVDLVIDNNSSDEFSMLDNTVTLNVPEGLTIMDTLVSESGATVNIPEIQGKTSHTVSWIVRGDEPGDYHLSADYSGMLSGFNVPISAQFKTVDPIKVYALTNMSLNVIIPDELRGGQLFYGTALTNDGDIDVYRPRVDADDILLESKYYNANEMDISAIDVAKYKELEDLNEEVDVLPPGHGIVRYYKYDGVTDFKKAKQRLVDYYYEVEKTYGLKIKITTVPLTYFKILPHNVVRSKWSLNEVTQFDFNPYEEIEDLVRAQPSTEYNARLAHFLIVMAESAYSGEDMVEANLQGGSKEITVEGEKKRVELTGLGFNSTLHKKYDPGHVLPAYTLAKKKCDDGSSLVMVTVRGTDLENSNNLLCDLAVTNTEGQWGNHSGFDRAAETILEDIKENYGISTQNTTYVLTGHSLGGATANLLAQKLKHKGVSIDDIYDYNFGCPDVATAFVASNDWNPPSGENYNIYNIADARDMISYVPGKALKCLQLLIDMLLGQGINIKNASNFLFPWGKFGYSYWYSDNWEEHENPSIEAHVDGEGYTGHFSKLDGTSKFKSREEAKAKWRDDDAFGIIAHLIMCPVDVTVYDQSGNPVAGVVDNKPNYYDSKFGEVMIFVNGDQKIIFLPDDKKYDVRMTGTDDGEMTYATASANLLSEEIRDYKVFDSVELSDGKEMRVDSDPESDIGDTKLYTVDENDNIISEIQQDGSEVMLIDNATVTGITDKTYTGSALTQTPTVKMGETILKEGADYELSYENNVNVGTAAVIIKGVGNYSGSIRKTFKINAAPVPAPTQTTTPTATEVKPNVPSEIVDLPAVKISKPTAAKKSVTVKWKKVNKKNQKKIQGIEIQVAADSGFTKIVKSTNAGKKKISKKIKGLQSKQTYWVRIRAYKNAADGKHVSAWKSKKVKIK